jgi:uncharacterized membrane protein YozB (DUF420 family)
MTSNLKPRQARDLSALFLALISLLMLCVVVLGFSRTFYLRPVLTPEQMPVDAGGLPWFLHLHGVALTLWFIVAAVQPWLVVRNNASSHRKMGRVALTIAMVVIPATLLVIFKLPGRAATTGMPLDVVPFVFFGDLFAVAVFSVLVTLGWLRRRDRESHGRLMLLASIAIIAPAAARVPLAFGLPLQQSIAGVSLLSLMLAMIAHDLVRTRRVHWSTALGCGLFVLANGAGVALGLSDIGRSIVAGL